MNFPQRLKRFLFGVIIGVLLSIFFFSDKVGVLTSWTPSNRVKARVIESYRMDTDYTGCLLDCYRMDWDSLLILVKNADVEFGRSKTDGEPKEYQLVDEKTSLNMRFAVRDSTVRLLDLSGFSGRTCDCDN